MRAKIVKGKIIVELEDPDMTSWMHSRTQILNSIGSAKTRGEFVPEVSCVASPHNLRKLRQMGCKLVSDEETMLAVGEMRKERDVYEAENKAGDIAKISTSPVIDYKFKMTPFDHQVLGFNFLHSMKEPALFGDCGTGKGLCLSTGVLTNEGWVTMGTLEIGSMVVSSDGHAYPVEAIYEQGEQDIYKVTFSDGTSTVCDGDHLWLVKTFNDVARNGSWRRMSTLDLLKTELKYGTKKQSRRWRIPMVKPVIFKKAKLPIAPYVLGVLLGDGSITSSTPRWTKDDLEIAERIKALIPDDTTVSKLSSKNRTQSWSIRKKSNGIEMSSVAKSLKDFGLIGCKSPDKFIPELYLYSSPDDRVELLRGLMDTDGSGGKSISFSSSSLSLAEGVVFIVQSLGGTATSSPRKPSYTYQGESREGLLSWRVYISMPSSISPFHLSRKKSEYIKLEPRRCIDSIEHFGNEKTRCIRVGSPDRTFVTEQFVVTHNTFIALTFVDSLIDAGEKWVVLVVCPVNLIKHVWEEDSKTFTDLSIVGLREDSSPSVLGADWDEPGDPVMNRNERAALRKKRKTDTDWKKKAKGRSEARYKKKVGERFLKDVDIYVVNPENIRDEKKEKLLKSLLKRKLKEGYKVCLIVDESSKLKSRTSKTYRSLKRLRAFCERCIIMTGTPSPNGILDLWAQFSLLDNGKTLQSSFTDYRSEVAIEQVLHYVKYKDRSGTERNATKWVPKPGAAIQVYKTLKPRMIRFRTEDCIDLPPKRFLIRDVAMNAKQISAYSDMEKMLFVEIEGEEVTAKIAATKLLKLRQITGGFIRTDEGDDIPLGKTNPKMEELDGLLEQSIADKIGDDGPPSKALIWAQYRWECKALVKRYAKYGARGLFGGISSKAKDNAISKFKSDPDARVLVCHPGSVGHGLTLIDANYAFYYSLSYNFEEFYQSYRRITRPGQKRSMTFYFLVCPDSIDEELVEVIRAKKDLSDIITDGELSREEFIAKRKKRKRKSSTIEMKWDIPDGQKENLVPAKGR